jgi:hypothetical protein
VTVREHFDRHVAHYRRPVRLGCSTIAHDRLGFCAVCVRLTEGRDTGVGAELNGWRLLAMAEAEERP